MGRAILAYIDLKLKHNESKKMIELQIPRFNTDQNHMPLNEKFCFKEYKNHKIFRE